MSTSGYHHGDLRNALLAAAENILLEEGPRALTLRACARTAGVSHAAPKHHFENISGLLTALATDGFKRMRDFQTQALEEAESNELAGKLAAGMGYIDFALAHPALFDLMFRDPRIDRSDPAYREAVQAVGNPVLEAIKQTLPAKNEGDEEIKWIQAWSVVHGFSMLAINGLLSEGDIDSERLHRLALAVLTDKPPMP